MYADTDEGIVLVNDLQEIIHEEEVNDREEILIPVSNLEELIRQLFS